MEENDNKDTTIDNQADIDKNMDILRCYPIKYPTLPNSVVRLTCISQLRLCWALEPLVKALSKKVVISHCSWIWARGFASTDYCGLRPQRPPVGVSLAVRLQHKASTTHVFTLLCPYLKHPVTVPPGQCYFFPSWSVYVQQRFITQRKRRCQSWRESHEKASVTNQYAGAMYHVKLSWRLWNALKSLSPLRQLATLASLGGWPMAAWDGEFLCCSMFGEWSAPKD